MGFIADTDTMPKKSGFIPDEEQGPSQEYLNSKIGKTLEGTKNKIKQEAQLTAEGKQSPLQGGAYSVLHAGAAIPKSLMDILSPLWENDVSKGALNVAGKGAKLLAEGSSSMMSVPKFNETPEQEQARNNPPAEPNKLVDVISSYMKEHPEVGSRVESGLEVASMVPGEKVAADAVKGTAKYVEKEAAKYAKSKVKAVDDIVRALNKTTEGKALIATVGEDEAVTTLYKNYVVKKGKKAVVGEIPKKIGGSEIERAFNPEALKNSGFDNLKLDTPPTNLIKDATNNLTSEPGKLVGKQEVLNKLTEDATKTIEGIAQKGFRYSDLADMRQAYVRLATSETDPVKKQFYESMVENLNKHLGSSTNPDVAGLESIIGPTANKEGLYRTAAKKALDEKTARDEAMKKLLKRGAIGTAGALGAGAVGKGLIDYIGGK
jgi:hypothetical protein